MELIFTKFYPTLFLEDNPPAYTFHSTFSSVSQITQHEKFFARRAVSCPTRRAALTSLYIDLHLHPPPPPTKKKRIHVDYRRAVLFASLVLLRDFVFLYNFIFFPFPFLRLQIEAIYGTQSIPDGQKGRKTVACREGRTGVFSLCMIRESSFNMTRGDEENEGGGGGLRKLLDTRKGGSGKIVGLGGGVPRKCVYFKTNRSGSS